MGGFTQNVNVPDSVVERYGLDDTSTTESVADASAPEPSQDESGLTRQQLLAGAGLAGAALLAGRGS